MATRSRSKSEPEPQEPTPEKKIEKASWWVNAIVAIVTALLTLLTSNSFFNAETKANTVLINQLRKELDEVKTGQKDMPVMITKETAKAAQQAVDDLLTVDFNLTCDSIDLKLQQLYTLKGIKKCK